MKKRAVAAVNPRGTLLTIAALIAFAANSILCRMALQDSTIDAASFSGIRVMAGAATLMLLLALQSKAGQARRSGSWPSAVMLSLYVICFSYAYIELSAGTGALILFGLVQATMVVAALVAGDKPSGIEVLGWLLAIGGMAYLLLPGAEAPSVMGSLLMALAGIAWGVYSIRGAKESAPLAATASNFARSCVFIPILFVLAAQSLQISPRGVWLAIASGAITSGIGYVIWYAALRYLKTLQAALVQLSVPALAAGGGVILLGEVLSLRLVISTTLILGGIFLALLSHSSMRQGSGDA